MTPSATHTFETIRALIANGDNAEAARACEQLLYERAGGAETSIIEGLLLTLNGKPNEALAAYDKAVSLAPNALPAYIGIAEILAESGWLHSAVVVMENARAATSFSSAANTLLDRLNARLPAARSTPDTAP